VNREEIAANDHLVWLLKRDRLMVSVCLAVVTLIAADYILAGAGMGMTAVQMTVPMQYMGADTGGEWTPGYTLSIFFMWWVMMIAMMLPSAAPTILLAAALNRRAQVDAQPYGSTAAFTAGYLLAWAAFSLIAVALQYFLQRAGMLSMHLESVNSALTGALLLAAGAWQLSPMKNACLSHCRSPVQFLTRYRKPGTIGALYMGMHHGLYCLGCCWFLMALLFVGGVMNLYWIVGLALFVFIEKVLAPGRQLGKIAGVGLLGWGAVVLALLWSSASSADSAAARCDIYPAGEDHATRMLHCTFSQRQGYITINREDGVVHELSPEGDVPGNYVDDKGRKVYRQSGLGDQGSIFRFPDESVYVYWSTAALEAQSAADNPTAPFTTDDYDATTLLNCRAIESDAFSTCPAGILRMEDKQASIVVQSPAGEQFTINFMMDYVNATNRDVDAQLHGDTWTVTINGKEVYEVPLAAIEGG